ncbi:hypothetical protein LGQ03_07275 [Loktanella sp. TSTF-M6]|uniref:Uncharacterized protein n=1 Tax=Loktanella gaetbuli TaxID=2881335 RepID=A0ABS8BTJ2_9RHOB|nr:hypothetical protein [Loktanella gaetbuli]MCB5199037.1 hypothetical protein [Loktanella gaetbuli]
MDVVPVIADQNDAPRPPLRAMLDELAASDENRMPWPDDWFDGVDPAHVKGCRALWASALLALIRDAFSTPTFNQTQTLGKIRATSSWIGSRDFHMVCALAGLDSVAVLDRCNRFAAGDEAALLNLMRNDFARPSEAEDA